PPAERNAAELMSAPSPSARGRSQSNGTGETMSCSMMRSIALLIVFLVGASATPAASQEIPSAAPAKTAPEVASPDASPSDVYLMYEAQQRAQQAQLRHAARALEPLAAAGRREELERARSGMLESLDTESLMPFLSRARAADWKAMPVAERRMEFARSLSPLAVPS